MTISLVPFMIYKIRKDLTFAVQDQNATRHVVAVGTKMLNKLNEIFGTGAEGTVAYADEGARRRPRGIPLITLMASILDPRMKAGIGIPHLDKTFVWRMIREDAINLAVDNLGDAQAQQEPNIPAEEPEGREWRQQPNLNQPRYDAMFEEINNNYAAEQQQLNNNVYAHNDNNNAMLDPHQQQVQNIAVSVDAELTLYSREPSIPLRDDSGRFSCPLTWWNVHRNRFKLISEVAIRMLCIPATSAPSERVFSVAGLTIAKERARLAPHTANELIFLHDALPALEKYKRSRAE